MPEPQGRTRWGAGARYAVRYNLTVAQNNVSNACKDF